MLRLLRSHLCASHMKCPTEAMGEAFTLTKYAIENIPTLVKKYEKFCRNIKIIITTLKSARYVTERMFSETDRIDVKKRSI